MGAGGGSNSGLGLLHVDGCRRRFRRQRCQFRLPGLHRSHCGLAVQLLDPGTHLFQRGLPADALVAHFLERHERAVPRSLRFAQYSLRNRHRLLRAFHLAARGCGQRRELRLVLRLRLLDARDLLARAGE